METRDDFLKQIKNFLVRNVVLENGEQDLVVNTGEELPDVAFQDPTLFGVVVGDLAGESSETV